MGSAWQANGAFAEDDVIQLSQVGSTAVWSEDGTNTPDGTNNRIRVLWDFPSTSTYRIRIEVPNNFTGTSSFVNAASYSYYSSGKTIYTFKDAWNNNWSFALNSAYMTTSQNTYSSIFKAFNFVNG